MKIVHNLGPVEFPSRGDWQGIRNCTGEAHLQLIEKQKWHCSQLLKLKRRYIDNIPDSLDRMDTSTATLPC